MAMVIALYRADQLTQAAAVLDRDSVAIYAQRQSDKATLDALGARLNKLPDGE
ncbi:hypothetical protein RBU55_18405 [Pseudomonas chlororaphis subsp. aurantiaca]|uniref:hypothetical protein n=1 Tax=Pseudomonas chlororaphis TaxID=587753 RepID=UPI0027DE4D72|nr:hypothetical protein [Pseudomonas chlororaphis]WMI97538.1 hypothetical protein RBU55_18405 [Pseudomonas chlororaphis subsp. aurantiaca]